MSHPRVKEINITEKDINTQLYIFHYKIVEALLNLQPEIINDDFRFKKEQVQIALNLVIEKRPEWFFKAHLRDGKA
jgi:hypothetical protein